MKIPSIYLCSISLRRAELLKQINVPFEIIALTIDESPLLYEKPHEYVKRIAQKKSTAGFQHIKRQKTWPVLAADTVVIFNNQILGKPTNKETYLTTLLQLSDNTHTVITAVSIMYETFQDTIIVETQVTFKKILPEELEYYWENYHPTDKAGGYGIQDFGAVFVEKIQGSYSNVVGLPLKETYELLQFSRHSKLLP